jgi:hypothetical protein
LESVIQQDVIYEGPWFYHSCGRFIPLEFNDGAQVRMQTLGPPFCYYPNDPQNGCFKFFAGEWMTFQVHIKIGTWNTPSSTIEIWAAREKQTSVKIYDSAIWASGSGVAGFTLYNGNPNAKYGKIWLIPYNTNKDPSETYATTYTWYDELIISRQRIGDPR